MRTSLEDFLDEHYEALVSKADLAKKAYKYLLRSFIPDYIQWAKRADWSKETVPISSVHMTDQLHDESLVSRFRDRFMHHQRVHPIVLMASGSKFYIADGRHRTLGAEEAGMTHIRAWVARRHGLPIEHVLEVERQHGEAQTQAGR